MIPKEALDQTDAMDAFLTAGIWAGELTNPNAAARHLAIMTQFMGTWENSGSFMHQASCWSDALEEVEPALNFFGCTETVSLLRQALALSEQIDEVEDSDLDDEAVDARVSELLEAGNELDRLACKDTPYEKLVAVIRSKVGEFGENSE